MCKLFIKKINEYAGVNKQVVVYCSGEEGRVIDEARLIEQIRQGDTSQMRLLIEKYSQHVYHVAYSVLRNDQEAQDAAQEAFIQMVKSLPDYRSEGFKTWLTRIAFHKAIDAKRKVGRRSAEDLGGEEKIMNMPGREEDVLARLVREERQEKLRERIKQLPAQHRDIITAYYLSEKNYEQIARDAQVAVKTVESRLYRARQWIRNHWKEDEWREE
ncbi:RNA polymerase sigma factor [Paenibacillus xylanivorans]|uniref:RNA polymerase sigma factor n=1 Tax=Paenibacillus xylanivorans TaxID=1705561 RepID=UPI0009E7C0E9|nr:RNA polymerase sigma factor [Paenibacillus xylanivorans]